MFRTTIRLMKENSQISQTEKIILKIIDYLNKSDDYLEADRVLLYQHRNVTIFFQRFSGRLTKIFLHQLLYQIMQEDFINSCHQDMAISRLIEERIKAGLTGIGNQHRYQLVSLIFFCLFFFFVLTLITSPSYYFMNPIFECQGVIVDEDTACSRLQSCRITNDYTITADNKLYCDRKDQRQWIISMFGVGSVVGALLVNLISDYQGRKVSLILALAAQISSLVLLLIGSQSDSIGLLMLSQMLAGYGASSLLTTVYVYADKVMSKKWANRSFLIACGFGVFSEMIFIFFCGLSNWKALTLYVLLIPLILTLIGAIWFFVQDPILLYSKNQIQRCKKSLTKIAQINRKQDELQGMFKIIDKMEAQGLKLQQGNSTIRQKLQYLKTIITQKVVILPIICLAVHSFGGNFMHYTLNFTLSQVGYSYGVTMLVFGIAEFLGAFPLLPFINRLPRIKSLFVILFIIFGFCLLFFFELSPAVQTFLLACIRFCLVSQYAIYVYLSVESFSQHIQATCIGIIETISQSGKLIAPVTISLANRLHLEPIIFIGCCGMVFMMLPLLFLKETLKIEDKDKKVIDIQQVDIQGLKQKRDDMSTLSGSYDRIPD